MNHDHFHLALVTARLFRLMMLLLMESRGHTTFAFDLPHGGSKAHNKIGQVAGLPEQTPHVKGRFPLLPSNIVTDCADL